jgi:hypothetical protein
MTGPLDSLAHFMAACPVLYQVFHIRLLAQVSSCQLPEQIVLQNLLHTCIKLAWKQDVLALLSALLYILATFLTEIFA